MNEEWLRTNSDVMKVIVYYALKVLHHFRDL